MGRFGWQSLTLWEGRGLGITCRPHPSKTQGVSQVAYHPLLGTASDRIAPGAGVPALWERRTGQGGASHDFLHLHVLPTPTRRTVEHRVADFLGLQGIAEGGVAGGAVAEGFEEVGDLVDEAVLVADL